MCAVCVLCLILAPLPTDKAPFVAKIIIIIIIKIIIIIIIIKLPGRLLPVY
jgi:hypothetical protein